jgi:hypothetical protein
MESNMIVTKINRDAHLRSESKFYVAGWVASEGGETPQAKTLSEGFPEYYADYQRGYDECSSNTWKLSLPPFNVHTEARNG